MSKETNITLSICGNADSNSGYQQLVAIEPAFYPEDKPYSAVLMNDSYYTLQIRTDVTILIKTVNNVCSYGQTRDGRLRLGISIPAGLCVSNPKMLIDEIEMAFKNNYMTPGQKWQFKRSEYDANVFSSIIRKYPLHYSTTAHRAMTMGGEVAYVFTPRIMELLYDYQYREFQPYGEIVIAETGTATTGVINSLSIPRQPIYEVQVLRKGRNAETADPIIDTAKVWNFTILPDDQNVNAPVSVEFSIDELKGMPSGDKDFEGGQVSLDERLEKVSVKVHSFPERVFNCRLAITGENIDLSKIRLNNSYHIKAVSATGNFQLKGREIYDMWTLTYPSDRTLTISPSELNFQSQLTQSIMVSKPKPVVSKHVEPYLSGNKDPKPADDSYIMVPVEATIVNPQGADSDIYANIFMTQSQGGWEYARKITLSKVSEDVYGKTPSAEYKGKVPVSKEMAAGGNRFSIRATVPSLNIHFKKTDVELRKDSSIILGDDKPGNGIKRSMPLLYAILMGLSMLLVGSVAGWSITKWLSSGQQVKESTSQQVNGSTSQQVNGSTSQQVNGTTRLQGFGGSEQQGNGATPSSEFVDDGQSNYMQSDGPAQTTDPTSATINKIEDEYEKKLNHIKTLSFRFAEIASYEAFLLESKAREIDNSKSRGEKLSYHIAAAKTIYNAITSNNANIENEIGNFTSSAKCRLTQPIRAAVCAIYVGDYRDSKNHKNYTTAQKSKAIGLAKECNSYQELFNIPDHVFASSND